MKNAILYGIVAIAGSAGFLLFSSWVKKTCKAYLNRMSVNADVG